jgi:hypothetical protein
MAPFDFALIYTCHSQILTLGLSLDIPLYHSKPGASATIFIDVDGHVIEGTAWNNGRAATLNAWPLDSDGNLGSFSASEQAVITGIWRRMAEDFAPFDVDVTTEEPSSFNSRTCRCLITRDYDLNNAAMPSQGTFTATT